LIDDVDDIEANTSEFLETHGLEGFLTLYYRQLFYRFVKQELQSAATVGDEKIEDVTIQMYHDVDGDDVLQDKRTEMKQRCEEWAIDLVDSLKDDPVVGDVIESSDITQLADEEVGKRIMEQFHEAIEDWEANAELDHSILNP